MAGSRIIVVDDHEVVRVGLRTVLEMESDLDVIGEVGGGEQAIEMAERLHPDIVLMDVRMDGIAACRVVREVSPETRVIMITSFADDEAVFAAILASAAGYLLKNTGRGRTAAGDPRRGPR